MKLLVTGGAGYIGSIVARQLLDGGHEVTVLDNLERGHREAVPEGAELVVADLLDRDGGRRRRSRGGFDGVAALRGAGARGGVGQPPRALLPDERRRDAEPARGDGRAPAFRGSCSPRPARSTGSPTRSRSPRRPSPRPINAYGASKLAVDLMIRDFCTRPRARRGQPALLQRRRCERRPRRGSRPRDAPDPEHPARRARRRAGGRDLRHRLSDARRHRGPRLHPRRGPGRRAPARARRRARRASTASSTSATATASRSAR